jgi:MoaA/NifB/PqqE/SkfB family radical SAM enzyme
MEDFRARGPYWLVYFPTDACNYKCRHCYLENIPAGNEMCYEEVMKIFSNSELLKTTRVGISGGEPFMKDDIVAILCGLSRLGFKLEITTNGAFPEKVREFLLNSNTGKIDMAVSIDGLKASNDQIRADGGFDKALETINVIKEIGINLLQVNTVIQKSNINHLEAIKKYFSVIVDHHFFIPLLSTKNSRIVYSDEEISKIIDYMPYRFDIKYLITKGAFRITDCHSGQSTCFIDPTGKVFTCMTGQRYFFPRKDYFMGDLRKCDYRFDALWASQQANIARDDVKKCEGCYNACEVHREKSFHGLDDNINWEIIN